MKKTIYPEIEIIDRPTSLILTTTLRKKHNGKWYFVEFIKSWRKIDEKDKIKATVSFSKEVYYFIILGKINKLLDAEGNRIYKLDPIQISETERVKLKLSL